MMHLAALKPNSLIIFDLDGTLIANPDDDDYSKWTAKPNRLEVIQKLKDKGHQIAIVSNQAYVAFGHATEQDVKNKLAQVIEYFSLPVDTPYEVCYHHVASKNPSYNNPNLAARRKPSPAMLEDICVAHPCRPTYFIGDAPDDQVAALEMQIPFFWAKDFFAPA